jgi:hypothetical protein
MYWPFSKPIIFQSMFLKSGIFMTVYLDNVFPGKSSSFSVSHPGGTDSPCHPKAKRDQGVGAAAAASLAFGSSGNRS